MSNPLRVVVLISGNGSNLQALIDSREQGKFEIVGVISNKANAYGLQRAANAGIPALIVDHQEFAERIQFDRQLMREIDKMSPGLIVLAGFMRILTEEFVKHYYGRILNIHPSLLPKYPGTNTHQRVIDAGEKEHGVSVHFVTEALDGGPVIAQRKVVVESGIQAEELEQQVHLQEHKLYPAIVALFAAGRLQMVKNRAYLDNKSLPETGALYD